MYLENTIGRNRDGLEAKFSFSFIIDLSSKTHLNSIVNRWLDVVRNPHCEVIFAVDASEVESQIDGLVYLVTQGPLAARFDQAAMVATGDLLIFVGAATEIDPTLLERLGTLFADADLRAVRSPILGSRQCSGMSGALGDAVSEFLLDSWRAKRVGEGSVRFCHLEHALTAVRRVDFLKVGGFRVLENGHGASGRLEMKLAEFVGSKQLDAVDLPVYRSSCKSMQEVLHDVRVVASENAYLKRRMPEFATSLGLLKRIAGLGVLVAVILTAMVTQSLIAASVAILTTVALILVAVFRRRSHFSSARRVEGRAFHGLVSGIQRFLARGFVAAVVLLAYTKKFLRPESGELVTKVADDRKLRVLVLNWRDRTHPRSGGAENYVYHLAQCWIENGVEVGWLTQRPRGGKSHEVIDGIEYFRVGGPISQYVRVPLKYLASLRGRYDVILDCENGIPFFSPLFSRLPKVLLVHHLHQEVFRRELPTPFRQIAMALEAKLMPYLYRRGEVVAVANQVKDDLVRVGFDPESVTVIKNGVHQPELPLFATSAIPSLLCLGRLVTQKSVDVLIRAVPKLVAELGDITVNIVGQGPERVNLERLALALGVASKVHFYGHVSSQHLDRIFSETWISVCPSMYEGWGMVCMEASVRGLPVVASNVPGLRESVIDGETGLLFTYGDSVALAETLIELIGDESRRKVLGMAGKHWAKAHSWRASAKLLEGLLYGVSNVPVPVGDGSKFRDEIYRPSVPAEGRLGAYFNETIELDVSTLNPFEITNELKGVADADA